MPGGELARLAAIAEEQERALVHAALDAVGAPPRVTTAGIGGPAPAYVEPARTAPGGAAYELAPIVVSSISPWLIVTGALVLVALAGARRS